MLKKVLNFGLSGMSFVEIVDSHLNICYNQIKSKDSTDRKEPKMNFKAYPNPDATSTVVIKLSAGNKSQDQIFPVVYADEKLFAGQASEQKMMKELWQAAHSITSLEDVKSVAAAGKIVVSR